MTTSASKGFKFVPVRGGMGGFLNPPTHPEHTQSMSERYRCNGREVGQMSLTAAAERGSSSAKRILVAWQPLPIESESVQSWIRQVLGYYRNCYRNPNVPEAEQAGKLCIPQDRNPMLYVDDHAGVHHIRKYYPTFDPTAEQFAEARWGK